MPYTNDDLKAYIFIPSDDRTSIGAGLNSLNDETTGLHNTALGYQAGSLLTTGSSNTLIGYNVASTTLATGSNNIIIGTSSAADAASSSTSNSFWLGGGSTAIMSATGINSTPAVTIPGSLTVTGAITASGGLSGGSYSGTVNGIGATVGGIASGSFSLASSTTLTAVTGMSATLTAGGTYVVDGYLATTNGSSGGIKLSFTGANTTITATTFLMDTWVYNTTTLTAEANAAALSSNLVAATVAATAVFFGGTIVVGTGGVCALYAAQNASNATATTITNGSYVQFTRIA